MEKIVLPKAADLHVHLRDTWLMQLVLEFTARRCSHALVMPNLDPAIVTGQEALKYRDRILAISQQKWPEFDPIMTIKITDVTTPQMVREAFDLGIKVAKAYPVGVTTNAQFGISNFQAPALQSVWATMEQLGMVLCIHGEQPGDDIDVFDREKLFMVTLEWLAQRYSSLRIVLEHVTTEIAVATVNTLGSNVAATITAHHLAITRNDILDKGIRPHNYCKPVAKRFADREALWKVILQENPKFFLGSDSAPHPKQFKECREGCAGIFTAPILHPLLAMLFEQRCGLVWQQILPGFIAKFGPAFYGFQPGSGVITLVRTPWEVPIHFGYPQSVVPFMAGQQLPFRYEDEQ